LTALSRVTLAQILAALTIGYIASAFFAAPIKWDDDDEDENVDKNTVALTSFFSKKGHDPKLDRHTYFKDRCIGSVENL
jgi:hypothetical protein